MERQVYRSDPRSRQGYVSSSGGPASPRPSKQNSSGFRAAKLWFKPGKFILQVTLRFTNSGTPVINVSVANNRSVKVGEERQSIADWFKVTVFGRDAEVITQYAKKGSALAFNGRLQNEKYVDRDGNQRTSTILVASSFEFVPMAKRDSGNIGEVTANGARVETVAGNETEEDIPF